MMLRRLLRILLPGGLLVGLALMVRRTMSLRSELVHPRSALDRWTPISLADATAAAAAMATTAAATSEKPAPAWLPPHDDGSCPPTHPIKAKAASHLYHLPGMFAYSRTKPERCYADEAAAGADGFTRAKR